MKRILLVFVLMLSTCIQAQDEKSLVSENAYPEKRFSFGILVTDFLSQRFTVSAAYRIKGPNVLMLGIGSYMGSVDVDGDLLLGTSQPANSIYICPDYKRYLYGAPGKHFFTFVKTHFVYQNVDVSYTEKDWVPVNVGGINYLKYRDVNKNYHVENIGLGVEGGIEINAGPFFTEVSFGFQYKFVVSNDETPALFKEANSSAFYEIDYTGIAPVISLRLGFYLF